VDFAPLNVGRGGIAFGDAIFMLKPSFFRVSRMSIYFQCPNCSEFCAFEDQYAGRHAKCLSCRCRFMIPEKQGDKAKIIRKKLEPIEGFYRRAVRECWKIFVCKSNITALVFVAAMVSLEYLVGYTDYSFTVPGFRVQLPTGLIAVVISRGCLFWYYMQIVAEGAFDGSDRLPGVDMGGGFAFLWNLIKSVYLFAAAFLISVLPFAILAALLESVGIALGVPVKIALLLAGMFLFPMVLLTMAAGREIWMVFHVRYIFDPVVKNIRPYLVVVCFMAAAWLVQILLTRSTVGGFGAKIIESEYSAAGWLVLSILGRMLNLAAMHTVGLFGFHYRSELPQLQLESEN